MLTLAAGNDTSWFIPLVVFVYLAALIAYGAWHSRRIKTQEDFAVAGRSLTVPVLVGTMMATWIGTGSLISQAQKTYEIGIAMVLVPLGGAVGLFVLSRVAARIRRFEQITVQDILERRYGVLARILGTIAIITAYMAIVSYQYRAGGAVLHTIYPGLAEWCKATLPSGWIEYLYDKNTFPIWTDSSWGAVIAAAFIIGYTVLGGLLSVAYTDVVNGVVMIVGIVVGLPILLNGVGGFSGIAETFADNPSKLQFFGPIGPIKAINYVLPAMLLVMGEANLYQRFFAARDVKSAKRAGVILIFAVLFVEIAITCLAFVSSAAEPNLAPDQFGHVILIAAHNHLPQILGALVLAAAVAIIVSTADSFLLVSANSVVRDVYHRFLRPNASQTELVRASRLAVVVLGLVAFAAAFLSDKFFEVSLWAYTIYGASITPALMATFFWKRATGAGAAAGLASGTIVTIVWELLKMKEQLPEALSAFGAVLPAMAISVLLLVVVSLLTPPPKPEQWQPFTKEG